MQTTVKTCRYCGYISETGEHCTSPGCPGNVAATDKETIPAREKLAQFKLTDAQRLALLADDYNEALEALYNVTTNYEICLGLAKQDEPLKSDSIRKARAILERAKVRLAK